MSDPIARLNAALEGRYRIEHELGAGGMATVYLADDLKHERKVALKVLRPELATSLFSDRFLREIEIIASLSHPHILPMHDSGLADGLLFYVMPLVDGESLRDRLRREEQLPIPEAIAITRTVGIALDYAHARNVVHRDIKPENILLQDGQPVVADFGIALAFSAAGGERLTGTAMSIGTPAYMSPEQAGGSPYLDGRSDQFSLACVTFEMLCGEPPFFARSPQAILAKTLTDTVPDIRVLRSTVPVAVQQVLEQALAKSPADRFGSVTAMGDALDEAIKGAPSNREQSRYRRASAVAAVVVMAAGAGWGLLRGSGGAGPVPAEARIAVLPAMNRLNDSAVEFQVRGVTEALTRSLRDTGFLQVLSHEAADVFRDSVQFVVAPRIAAALGVEFLLDASVWALDDTLRVALAMIDGAQDAQVWNRQWARSWSDEAELYRDIAQAVVSSIAPERAATARAAVRPLTSTAPARAHYRRGRYALTGPSESLEVAQAAFEAAIAQDSLFVLPWVGLGDVYASRATRSAELAERRPSDFVQQARGAYVRAVGLDARSVEARVGLAALDMFHGPFDYDAAGAGLELAIELQPQNERAHEYYSLYLVLSGRVDQAIEHARTAVELSPTTPSPRAHYATALIVLNRCREARSVAREASNRDVAGAHGLDALAMTLWCLGESEEALRLLLGANRRVGAMADTTGAGVDETRWLLGYAYARVGRRSEALRVVESLEASRSSGAYVPERWLAWTRLGLGDHDGAVESLERSISLGEHGTNLDLLTPLMDPLRDHPGFPALLIMAGLEA